MSNEWSVTVDSLLMVERLRVSCAFAGMVRAEVGEEVEDAFALLDIWMWDVSARMRAMKTPCF